MSRLSLRHIASPYDIDEDVIALAHYERELRKNKGVDQRDPDYVDLPHPRFSAPARLVQPVEPLSYTDATFSRSLDERHPTERSSCAQIVPMDPITPMHPAERLVLRVSACCGVLLMVLLAVEKVFP